MRGGKKITSRNLFHDQMIRGIIDTWWQETSTNYELDQNIPSTTKGNIYRRVSNIIFNRYIVVYALQKWYHKEVLEALRDRNIKIEEFDINSDDKDIKAVVNKFKRRPKFEEKLLDRVVEILQSKNWEGYGELVEEVRGLANDMVYEFMTDEGKAIRTQRVAPLRERMQAGRMRRHEKLRDSIRWIPGDEEYQKVHERQIDDDDGPPQQDSILDTPQRKDGDEEQEFGDF